jgi:hypothetical protein
MYIRISSKTEAWHVKTVVSDKISHENETQKLAQ